MSSNAIPLPPKRSRSQVGALGSSPLGSAGGSSSNWGDASTRHAAKRQRTLDVVSHQETNVHAVSAKLEWRIDHFEKLMRLFRNGQNIISRQFKCEQAPECVWELHVYPNGKRDEDNGHVSFFLRQVGLQGSVEPIMTEFQIFCLDNTNQRVSICKDTKDFTHQQGRGKFQVTRDKMTGAIRSHGEVVLICDVEYFAPGSKLLVQEVRSDGSPMSEMNDASALSFGPLRPVPIKNLLTEQLFTDATIAVGAHTLHVHRCILALHSRVFRQMFSSDLMEARDGHLTMHDTFYEPVRALVEYMYTPESLDEPAVVAVAATPKPPLAVDNTSSKADCEGDDSTTGTDIDTTADFSLVKAIHDYAEDILALADKYDVGPLKHRCERMLADRLTARSVCEVLMFADTYNCTFLKQACVRLLREEHHAVLETEEWRCVKRDNPTLASELLESILSGNDISSDSLTHGDSVRVTSGHMATLRSPRYPTSIGATVKLEHTRSASSSSATGETSATDNMPATTSQARRVTTRARRVGAGASTRPAAGAGGGAK